MSIEKPDESTNSDPTELPPWWRSGLNYIEAVARYVASGCRNVPEEVYRERLRICSECPLCRGGKCLICGCNLQAKAEMAVMECPHGTKRWGKFT
jgi:hypothetical protein